MFVKPVKETIHKLLDELIWIGSTQACLAFFLVRVGLFFSSAHLFIWAFEALLFAITLNIGCVIFD
jgi:hypothetical protein